MPAKGYLQKVQLSANGTACTWLGIVSGNAIGEPADVERLDGAGDEAAVFAGVWRPAIKVSGQGGAGLKTLLGYALRASGTDLSTFYMFTKDNTTIKKWSGCKVDSITIRATVGKPVEFDATIMALDGTAVAAPTWASAGALEQLSAFTNAGTAHNIVGLEFGVSNSIKGAQYGNASAGSLRKLSALNEGKADYTYRLTLPAKLATDLSGDTVAGLAQVATATDGTTSMILTFAGVVPKAADAPVTNDQADYEADCVFTTVALT